MVITRVSDGLGNQMFQYAIGKRIAQKNGEELKVDIRWYEDREKYGGTDRKYTLGRFNIDESIALEEDIKNVIGWGPVGRYIAKKPNILDTIANRVVQKPVLKRIPSLRSKAPYIIAKYLNYVKEYSMRPEYGSNEWAYRRRFYEPILNIKGGVYLDGYWQSFMYIEDIKNNLRKEYKPRNMKNEIKELAKKMRESTSVAVHVRRGDFTTQGPGNGNVLPNVYYKKSANIVEKKVEEPTYYVFSDDPEWAKEKRLGGKRSVHVSHKYGTREDEDVYLMSLCNHNIMANSTFSWWSSWLNDNEEKIVTVPSPWKKYGYPDGVVNDWDLFPEEWQIVRY